jgi:hypothetical protein
VAGHTKPTATADNSNANLVHHLSEAIRIVRDRDDLPMSLAEKDNSEAGLLLTLDTYIAQTTARKVVRANEKDQQDTTRHRTRRISRHRVVD